MKKWIFGIIIIIALAIVVIAVKAGGKKKDIVISTAIVSRGDISETATAVGSIVPESTTTVKSQLEGNVSHIYYDSGKYVKKGEIKVANSNPSKDDKDIIEIPNHNKISPI